MKVSCVIPIGADNHTYLQDAIDSALSCFDEVIVCCAAPVEFLPSVQLSLNRGVRLIVDYDGSFSDHVNLGVQAARNEWVGVLCSDDLAIGEGCNQLRHFIDRTPTADCAFAQVQEFGDDRFIWPWSNYVDVTLIEQINCVPVGAWFRRRAWHHVGGFENVPYADWHFFIKLYQAGSSIHFAGEYPFYAHRRWPGSEGAKSNYTVV